MYLIYDNIDEPGLSPNGVTLCHCITAQRQSLRVLYAVAQSMRWSLRPQGNPCIFTMLTVIHHIDSG